MPFIDRRGVLATDLTFESAFGGPRAMRGLSGRLDHGGGGIYPVDLPAPLRNKLMELQVEDAIWVA